MKSILLLCWMLLSSASLYAQTTLPVDAETKKITYSEVVSVEGVSQDELYSRAKVWLATAYNSAPDVIKADEKEAGVIVVRARTPIPFRLFNQNTTQQIQYALTLNFKEGRYKYILTDYQTVGDGAEYPVEQTVGAEMRKTKRGADIAKQYEDGISTHAKSMVDALHTALSKPTKDW